MATWVVYIRQADKSSNTALNQFNLTVEADTKTEAKNKALAELQALSEGIQTNHVQDNPFANAQRRPYRRIGWSDARNTIVAVKRVKG